MVLVDNQDFLVWSINFDAENPNAPLTDAPMPPLPDVFEKFDSSAGAAPFRTVKDLESALSSIFYQRAGEFLENPAIQDLPQFPNIEFCTKETQDVGF